MPIDSEEVQVKKVQSTIAHRLKAYGENSVPPTCIAVLVAAQHLQPFQPLPLLFVPAFIFSSYTNVAGHKVDAAGTSAAWSGLYMLLALRRKQGLRNKFTVRGAVRGATLALCGLQTVAGGLAYTFGRREVEDDES